MRRIIRLFLSAICVFIVLYYIVNQYSPQGKRKITKKQKTSKNEGKPVFASHTNSDYAERIKIMQEFCRHRNLSSSSGTSTQGGHKFHRDIYVIDQFKTVYCEVSKAGGKTWKAQFMDMAGCKIPQNIHSVKKISGLKRCGIEKLETYTQEEQADILKNYFKFIFVRHPFTRLHSIYRDKTPAKEKNSKHDMTINENIFKSSEKDDVIKLTTFLKSVATHSTKNINYQTYMAACDPCTIRYDFIGKQEFFKTDANYLIHDWFKKPIVPALTGDLSNHTEHASYDVTKDMFWYVPDDVKEALVSIYWDDFDMFGYSWEEFMK